MLGLELARVLVILVGAVNAALVAAASRRLGLLAAAVAGTFYAVWPPVAMSETQPRLEPFVSLGLLVALAVLASRPDRVRGRGLVLLGCALGFALTVKIWAVVPVLVILAAVCVRYGARALARVSVAVLATATVICLPFWAAAPSAMFRMVIHDQISRGRMAVGVQARLAACSTCGSTPGSARVSTCPWPPSSPWWVSGWCWSGSAFPPRASWWSSW